MYLIQICAMTQKYPLPSTMVTNLVYNAIQCAASFLFICPVLTNLVYNVYAIFCSHLRSIKFVPACPEILSDT
jgi:hypothetical protein